MSAKNITELGATFEAQINPEGSETTYEFWLECGAKCGSGSPERVGLGHIPAGDSAQAVSVKLSDLRPGYFYTYWVIATNSAGKAESHHRPLETQALGACDPGCPYKAEFSEAGGEVAEEVGRIIGEEAVKAIEAERQAKAAKEQTEREVPSERVNQPSVTPTSSPPTPATGGVSLAAKSVTVQTDGMALVKLNCLGIASCHGKLTLMAKDTVKGRGAKGKKEARMVTIGTVSFTISGDETKTVKIKLNSAGRSLLSSDHRRLDASLEVLELAPVPRTPKRRPCVSCSEQSQRGPARVQGAWGDERAFGEGVGFGCAGRWWSTPGRTRGPGVGACGVSVVASDLWFPSD